MANRAELAQRLASIPSKDLLTLLEDEALVNLASRYSQRATTSTDGSSPGEASTDEDSNQRAKRPLNAFIAFRSYYLQLFPDDHQKAVSGFLTTLWNKDPFRNKWALIAKVYSFIRDEIGKDRISLPFFLSICCPIMNIIEPALYLSSLGWSVEVGADGTQILVHDKVIAANFARSQAQDFPTTEMDLLQSLLKIGYLPRESARLLQQMSSNTNGMMTTSPIQASPTIPPTLEKLDFINTIRNDPIQATKEIFSAHFDGGIMREHGYRVYDAQNLNSITHLPMALPIPQPIPYRYAHTHHHLGLGNGPVMNFNNIPQNGCYDLSNPFHMDHLLGHTDSEGERADGHPDSPPFDEQEDFHYMF